MRRQRDLLATIDGYLRSCFDRESQPRVGEVARLLGLSGDQLMETFSRELGTSPAAYLKTRQVEAAVLLLTKTDLSLTQVGYATGFGTRRTLFREFRRRLGTTPGHIRSQRENVSNSAARRKPGLKIDQD